MGPADERRIWQRLLRVEALHDGATTPGERQAAAAARERLLTKLAAVREEDPIARFCAEHVAELAVAPAPPPPPEPVPSVAEVLTVLARWEAGDWSVAQVEQWAEDIVGGAVLPEDPESAPVVEVLMQLASLDDVPLRREDVARIRRFLRTGDLADWFALVAEAMASRRRARAAAC